MDIFSERWICKFIATDKSIYTCEYDGYSNVYIDHIFSHLLSKDGHTRIITNTKFNTIQEFRDFCDNYITEIF